MPSRTSLTALVALALVVVLPTVFPPPKPLALQIVTHPDSTSRGHNGLGDLPGPQHQTSCVSLDDVMVATRGFSSRTTRFANRILDLPRGNLTKVQQYAGRQLLRVVI